MTPASVIPPGKMATLSTKASNACPSTEPEIKNESVSPTGTDHEREEAVGVADVRGSKGRSDLRSHDTHSRVRDDKALDRRGDNARDHLQELTADGAFVH